MTPSPSEALIVFVVEDEDRLRELLLREIAAMGHQVHGFRRAEDAWPRLESSPVDVLLLDLNLPGMNGMELFRRIHEATIPVAVVIMTGFGELDTAVQALRWDADDYLTKPCSLGDIERVLARILQRKRDRRRSRTADAPSANSGVERTPVSATPADVAAADGAGGKTLEDIEREQILATLAKHRGSKPAAAEELGISLRTLYNKLNSYRQQGYMP